MFEQAGQHKYTVFHPEDLYPTPRDRVENPAPTELQIGDWVEILIGPATGKLGIVVVDRNDNFIDSEPYVNEKAIGVGTFQVVPVDQDMAKLLASLTGSPHALDHSVLRWFDDPTQLRKIKLVTLEE